MVFSHFLFIFLAELRLGNQLAHGSPPGTSQSPNRTMSASVKYPQPPQLPQHPQPPSLAANRNSALPNLLDQAELGCLYKPACSSLSKESTTRSRQDYFPGPNLSFNCSQRSHRDYFSGSPCRAVNKNWTLTDPLREASSVASIALRESSDPAQTPPRPALPDVRLDVGAEPPEAAVTSRIPRAERPPVVLEIPSSSPEPSELRRCPDTRQMVQASSTWLQENEDQLSSFSTPS